MGHNKGSSVGARTANLDLPLAGELPKGLYLAQVIFERNVCPGLLYYGYNILTKEDCLEVHLLDFNGDLYGKKITVTTERYVRPPKKFTSLEELAAGVKKDLELVKKY